MTAIGVYQAKTHLPKLLVRVSRGERFVITKHGRPIAQLVPAEAEGQPDVAETIAAMERWQELHGPTLGPDLTIAELRDSGRRF